MYPSSVLGALGLAGFVASAPALDHHHSLAKRQDQGPQNVVYWGQNNNENGDLASYCKDGAGIDVLVLSFLYTYGGGAVIPSGNIGNLCFITSEGEAQNCDDLTSAIETCQGAGVKIILSLGGATSSYSLTSQEEAEAIGQNLWDAYGNSGNTTAARPFGKNIVDGWDFDIEVNGGSSQYYQYMIAKLRSNFEKDTERTYYITGAPQCPIPEPNMSEIIESSQFDYLFVQFYNNNNYTVPCSLGVNGGAPFNYGNWTSYISDTPSKDAKIFVGAPASPTAANGNAAGAVYYASPEQLAGIIEDTKSDAHFGGIMLWSAGYSDENVINGCTYAQEAKSILDKGTPC